MRRIFIGFYFLLFLFSCSPHLIVREVNTKNISVDSNLGSSDSLLEAFVEPYRKSIEKEMTGRVTVSATPLVKNKPESKLTNLVSDVLLECGHNYCSENKLNIEANASYVNYGGLRASLPEGNITVGHIFELMPFENEIVLLRISGTTLLQMADKIAERGGEGIAGMKLGIRDEKVASLTVGGKPVDPKGSYWLVTNDYIADGGDQMSMFANPIERINTKVKLRDALIKVLHHRYIMNGIISVEEDGRIYYEQ